MHSRELEAYSLNSAAEDNHFLGNYAEGLKMQFEALQIFRQLNNLTGQAETLGFIGVMYNELAEYRQALNYLIPGDSIFQRAPGKFMGCFTLDAHQKNPFIASLPGVIHLSAENLQAEPGLESTIRLLTLGLSRSGPGSDILISRLTDAVFIQAIRAYISQIKKCPESPGWLKALSDPEIGAALNLIH